MDGLGNINWWGFSPSVDLLKLYDDNLNIHNEQNDTINILIVNSGDQRHILKTLSSPACRDWLINKKKKIRFYIYEKMLELYARDFLLLSLALEHPSKVGKQEKTENYLEIYGNLFLRDYTSQLIQTKANNFIKLITDLDQLNKTNLNMFDFSLLKYKERDFLEGILKFWRIKETNKEYFSAQKCWDMRLRNYFGNRYDSRSNAFDWDFTMKLSDRKNASIINNRIYSKWRETGLAFELRDSNYDTPNKTLASSMVFNDPRNGDKAIRRGFFGDIIIGPYITYGIEHEDKEMFKKNNEFYKYSSIDISRSNINSIMEGLLDLGGLKLSKYNQKSVDVGLSQLKIEEIVEEENQMSKSDDEEADYIKIENFKIIFLPLTAFQDFTQKTKYDSYFDLVYFSNSGASQMNSDFVKVLKENSLIVFETAKYMIEMKNEQINLFSERLKQIAKENNFIDLNKYEQNDKNLECLDHLIFKRK